MGKKKNSPVLQAVLAAFLFGASTPLSKLMQSEIAPLPMSAFLFLGSGFGSLLFLIVQNFSKQKDKTGLKLSKDDIPWLVGAVLAGGVAAPAVLMYSLRVTPAATVSLLLNFEGVATMLAAVLIFKESLSKRTLIAIAAITAASVMLSWNTNGEWGFSLGAIGVLGACALWGADNNFTRNISTKDPLVIVSIKGLSAGAFSLILALAVGSPLPGIKPMVEAMTLGCLSYGTSTLLFILALRGLGAAKTGAFSGMAPFVGTAVSFLLFRKLPGVLFYSALPVMIFGVFMIVGEERQHQKTAHEPFNHKHKHKHNDKQIRTYLL